MNVNDNRRLTLPRFIDFFRGRRAAAVFASLFLLTLGSMLLARPKSGDAPQQVPQVILSGIVRETNGAPLPDVLIFVDGTRRASVVTGLDGSYSVSLPQGGNYTVTPYHQSITFRPGSLNFNVLNANQGNVNFVATRTGTFKVSGTVLDTNGQALSDVVVRISASPQILTVSGPTGVFSFDALTAGAGYTLTPQRQGYTFDPPQVTINNLNRNVPNVRFVAVSSEKVRISGTVTSNLGVMLPDVIVGLVGSENGLSTTAGEGAFAFTVSNGGTYTIAPAREGYTFNPPSLTFTNLTSNQTSVNFVGTQVAMVSISGMVLNSSGAPMADVPMMINGSATGSQPTGPAGNYQFSVLATGNYTIVPVVPGMAFLPPSRTFTNVTNDQLEVNFVASSNPTLGNTSEKVYEGVQLNLGESPTPTPEASPSPSPSPHERVTPTPRVRPTPKANPEASPKPEEKPSPAPGPSKPATDEKTAAPTTNNAAAGNKRRKSRRKGTRRTTTKRTGKSSAKKPPAKKKTTKK